MLEEIGMGLTPWMGVPLLNNEDIGSERGGGEPTPRGPMDKFTFHYLDEVLWIPSGTKNKWSM